MDLVVARMPTVEEYVELRRAVDWRVPARQDTERALAGTYAGVCAQGPDGVRGMGRLVGDGAFYWYIVDVVVRPEHQSMGLGRAIVSALEAVVAEHSATGVAVLVAGADVAEFYRRLGYEEFGGVLMAKAVARPQRDALRRDSGSIERCRRPCRAVPPPGQGL